MKTFKNSTVGPWLEGYYTMVRKNLAKEQPKEEEKEVTEEESPNND